MQHSMHLAVQVETDVAEWMEPTRIYTQRDNNTTENLPIIQPLSVSSIKTQNFIS